MENYIILLSAIALFIGLLVLADLVHWLFNRKG